MWNIETVSFIGNGKILERDISSSISEKPCRANQHLITCMALSRENSLLACASLDSAVRLWDSTSLKSVEKGDHLMGPLKIFNLPSVPTAMAFVRQRTLNENSPSAKVSSYGRDTKLLIATVYGMVIYADLSHDVLLHSKYIQPVQPVFNITSFTQEKYIIGDQQDKRINENEKVFLGSFIGVIFTPSEPQEEILFFCTSRNDICFYDCKGQKKIDTLNIEDLYTKNRETHAQLLNEENHTVQVLSIRQNYHRSYAGIISCLEVLFFTSHIQRSSKKSELESYHVMSIDINMLSNGAPSNSNIQINTSPTAPLWDPRLLQIFNSCFSANSTSTILRQYRIRNFSVTNSIEATAKTKISEISLFLRTIKDAVDSEKLVKVKKRLPNNLVKNRMQSYGMTCHRKRAKIFRKKSSNYQRLDFHKTSYDNVQLSEEVCQLIEIRDAWKAYITSLKPN